MSHNQNIDQEILDIVARTKHKGIYKDLDKLEIQLEELASWLELNRDTEDIKIVNELVIKQNKYNRLTKEYDDLLSVETNLITDVKTFIAHKKVSDASKSRLTELTTLQEALTGARLALQDPNIKFKVNDLKVAIEAKIKQYRENVNRCLNPKYEEFQDGTD